MNEYFDKRPGANTTRIRRLVFNLISFVFLLGSLVLGGAYGVILINPQVSFNPYPPPTLPPTVGPPTVTNTPAIYLPTEIPRSRRARPLPTPAPPRSPPRRPATPMSGADWVSNTRPPTPITLQPSTWAVWVGLPGCSSNWAPACTVAGGGRSTVPVAVGVRVSSGGGVRVAVGAVVGSGRAVGLRGISVGR